MQLSYSVQAVETSSQRHLLRISSTSFRMITCCGNEDSSWTSEISGIRSLRLNELSCMISSCCPRKDNPPKEDGQKRDDQE